MFFCEFTFKCRVEREVTSVEMGETGPHGCVCAWRKSGWKVNVKAKAISMFKSKATGGDSGRNSFRETKLHLKLKFWVARGALTFQSLVYFPAPHIDANWTRH